MARKRYETAFLPSSNFQSKTSPDVDSLILAIESEVSSDCDQLRRKDAFSVFGDCPETHADAIRNYSKASKGIYPSENVPHSCTSSGSSPSRFPCQMKSGTLSPPKKGGGHTSESSPCRSISEAYQSNMMSFSEPLPIKRYGNTIASAKSLRNSSSFGFSFEKHCLKTAKDTSVSSLESLDSTKSEDLMQSCLSSMSGCSSGNVSSSSGVSSSIGTKPSQRNKCKLLSPISDKSPLEPLANLTMLEGKEFPENSNVPSQLNELNKISAELTNVPWEMPKLRRKLALLADSGISLDCNSSKESDAFTGVRKNQQDKLCASSSTISSSNADYTQTTESELRHTNAGAKCSLQLSLDHEKNETVKLSNCQVYAPSVCTLTYQRSSCPKRPVSIGSMKFPKTSETTVDVHVHEEPLHPSTAAKPNRCSMKLDFSGFGCNKKRLNFPDESESVISFDPAIELERQDWFHGALMCQEAEDLLRSNPEGSFIVRNTEGSSFNHYSLSVR